MIRSHLLVIVSAAMLSGWLAHAQGPSLPGFPSAGFDNPNPSGIPQPISPDAKFRSGDPNAIPAPPALGMDGMPRSAPMPGMSPYYPPMPGSPNGGQPFYPPMPGAQPYPGMMSPGAQPYPGMMPPGAQPYPGMMPPGAQPYPGMMPPGAQPYPGMMPPGAKPYPGMMPPGAMPYYPNPRMNPMAPGMAPRMADDPRFNPLPPPEPGQPYMVPPTKESSDMLPKSLPSRTDGNAVKPDAALAVSPASYIAPEGPFSPREPYVLYLGGRTQKGLFSPCVQTGYCFWMGAEFLYWYSQNSPAPPALATTAPAGVAATINGLGIGAIGRADTTIVLGGQSIELVNHTGVRATLGAWFDDEQRFGVEANYMILPGRGRSVGVSATGAATDVNLTVPFLDVNPAAPGETSVVLADNAGINGSATLGLSSQLQGGEFNFLCNMVQYYGLNVHVLAGFRYASLYENLEFSTSERGALATQFSNTLDQFKTRNNFFGGQLGFRSDYQYKWFFSNFGAEVGYGNMVQNVDIAGHTFTNTGPQFTSVIAATTVPGGIFALPTNIGSYSRNRDALLAEATLNVGIQVVNSLRIFGGFNYMYINHVVRPGDQMDRSINSTQLPSFTGVPSGPLVGPANPAFAFRETSYWVGGWSVGLEFRY